jgi:acyl carrier protein
VPQLTQDEARAGLAEIWTATLGAEPRDDDDFFDAGGGSMELIMMMVAIQERFDVRLSVDELFADDFTFGAGLNGIVRAAPR